MRHILVLLFCVIFTDLSFGQGDAPALLQGQHQSTKSVGSFIQAPNKQITKISGATALMETGNKNLLENPSFEHPTVGFGWTDASTNTKSAETTVVIDGKKSLKIELSANDVNLTQESTLYASQFGGTTQGVASIRIKTDVLVVICTVEAGIVSTTNCLNSSLDSQWHVYKIPFVLGATSNGINIFVDSGTGTVYLDDAFVGAMEVTAVTDASRIAGEAVFPPTSSCIWFRNNAVIGAFASTNACPGPTIVKEYVGDWQTTDANLPQITVNALPAGVYKATFYVPLYSGAAAQNSLAINDGTTTCDAVNVHSNTDSGQGVVSCTFEYGVAGNRTFSLYGASSTSLINIENNTSGSATRGTKFQLEYYTSFSTYSSANADTDWVPCSFSTFAWQGMGTVTSPDIKCKRQGSDLLMRGRFTTGTVAASEARIPLPLWNGSALSVKANGLSVLSRVGGGIRERTLLDSSKEFSVLSGSGYSYLNISVAEYATTLNPFSPLTGSNAFLTSQLVDFSASIPIEGWQNSNIIIGQFNGLESCSSTLDCTDTFSATTSSAAIVSNENVEFISGNPTKPTTGRYTYQFNTGVFTQAPNCLAVVSNENNTAGTTQITCGTEAQTSTGFGVVCKQGSSLIDREHKVICQKQGVDYVGKTAKAVASDQSLRTPGATNVVQYSGFFSSAVNSTTACTTGTCAMSGGLTGSATATFVSTGKYSLAFPVGSFNGNSIVSCAFTCHQTSTTFDNYDSILPVLTAADGSITLGSIGCIAVADLPARTNSAMSFICNGVKQ